MEPIYKKIIHGNNYGKIHTTHTTGLKTIIYSICFFILEQEQIIKCINGLITDKNT